MKKYVVALSVLALVLLVGSYALAADKTTVKGKVSVTKNDEGAVTAIKVTAGEVVYNVTLDDNGKKVAEMDKKTVEIVGVVTTKEEVKWIAVETCKAVEEKKPE